MNSYSFFLAEDFYIAVRSWLQLLEDGLGLVWVWLGLLAFIQNQLFYGCRVAHWWAPCRMQASRASQSWEPRTGEPELALPAAGSLRGLPAWPRPQQKASRPPVWPQKLHITAACLAWQTLLGSPGGSRVVYFCVFDTVSQQLGRNNTWAAAK